VRLRAAPRLAEKFTYAGHLTAEHLRSWPSRRDCGRSQFVTHTSHRQRSNFGRWANLFLLRTTVRNLTLPTAMHHLEVRARFLADPWMWIADIRDSVTEEIIWSSWTDEWSAYDTVDEATVRASEMLRQLTSSRATAA